MTNKTEADSPTVTSNPDYTAPLSSREPGFEQRVFGRLGTALRNICGGAAVITVCTNAIIYSDTVRISVKLGHGFPDNIGAMISAVGPVICAFAYMNANRTIQTILNSGVGIKEHAKNLVMRKLGIAGKPEPVGYQTREEVKDALMTKEISFEEAENARSPDGRLLFPELINVPEENKKDFWMKELFS